MENKNHYISEEEYSHLLNNLSKSPNKDMINLCNLIYRDGLKIKEAFIKLNIKKSRRACEICLKRRSKGFITFMDLRKAYLLNHPEVLLSKRKINIKVYPIPARLRWTVLSRDNFRCIACGLSSKETVLHVDHIYPKAKGGLNTISNMQTLCALCNMGKSDKIISSGNNKQKKYSHLFDEFDISEKID